MAQHQPAWLTKKETSISKFPQFMAIFTSFDQWLIMLLEEGCLNPPVPGIKFILMAIGLRQAEVAVLYVELCAKLCKSITEWPQRTWSSLLNSLARTFFLYLTTLFNYLDVYSFEDGFEDVSLIVIHFRARKPWKNQVQERGELCNAQPSRLIWIQLCSNWPYRYTSY